MGRDALTYRFVYSDGTIKNKGFSSKREVWDFAHGEGDHLLQFYRVNRANKDENSS